MKKKIFLQFILLLFFLFVVWLVYSSYDSRNVVEEIGSNNLQDESDKKIVKLKELEQKSTTKNDNFENIIKNMSYTTVDDKGNKYTIFASQGRIEDNKPNIINMEGVRAEIEVYNYDIIYIFSDIAVFDNINFNSKFTNNVKLVYLDHKLKGEKLDLNLDTKLITLSDNVTYVDENTKLEADYIVLDLISKDSEISMYDKKKKVKIFQLD